MSKIASVFIAARLYLLALPLMLCATGTAMNRAVLVANNGTFPVICNEKQAAVFTKDGYFDEFHVLMTKQTRLNWLADWIDMNEYQCSPGDLLLWLYGFTLPIAITAWFVLSVHDLYTLKALHLQPKKVK